MLGIAVSADVNLPHWEGWHLIGAFPDHEPGDVGSWLLTDGGEAMLLEVPEGLTVEDVRQALAETGTTLRSVRLSVRWPDLFEYRPAVR
jgi:hypothetical protein